MAPIALHAHTGVLQRGRNPFVADRIREIIPLGTTGMLASVGNARRFARTAPACDRPYSSTATLTGTN